jgi:4a-hydroxytetrahydrobiopterin dehydratase
VLRRFPLGGVSPTTAPGLEGTPPGSRPVRLYDASVDTLDHGAVDAALAAGLRWERHGDELVTTRRGENFADALAYVNAVGALAEEMDHHPDIDIRWNAVTLRLTTHSAGGLTSLDLELARRIDDLSGPGG